jgi:hypothetical protein
MARDPHVQLARRRIDVDRTGTGSVNPPTGGVDEYLALQTAAVDRLARCGVETSAAALRLRAEAHRLVRESGLDLVEGRMVVEPIIDSAASALGEVQDELRRVVLHALRLGRNRLGLT